MSQKKLKLKPDSTPASAQLRALPKRKVRYWCFRFKTEVLEGVPAEGAPEGLRQYFEALEWFSSWEDFAVKWDVRESNPLVIRPLKENPEEVWNQTVLENAVELPTKSSTKLN